MRPRLLISAYHVDRLYSMESRLAWQRAYAAAEKFDVTVLCSKGDASDLPPADRSFRVETTPLTAFERRLMQTPKTFYWGYRRWARRVGRVAEQLHRRRAFDLVHHVSFCGYREPGECWRLGAPFLWGPVGGTHNFPWRFLSSLDLAGAAKEAFRNALNGWQLRHPGRIRRAAQGAALLLAANRSGAEDLRRGFGVEPVVQLETGVSLHRTQPRPLRNVDQPLRILWAGRLQPWKSLPLLLRALAELPGDASYELRILGQGPCERQWRRLAERLGVASRISWVGWSSDYRLQLPHYDWADVFTFTSLRDTSGTGLLEALAAGAPIIGLDHQGAADVMTDECALRVPVTTPAEAIAGFRQVIARLAGDSQLLARLSRGAMERAALYDWRVQERTFLAIYESILAGVGPQDAREGGDGSGEVVRESSRPTREPSLVGSTDVAAAVAGI
jgi:glycosyltransferase involved in cell wall biosynthesis